MNTTHFPAQYRLAETWEATRQRVTGLWLSLPLGWRSERALLVVAAVTALSLLAAFHQVVHAGVDRAAARDAAARRHMVLVAVCSMQRGAEQRALCLLTTPVAARPEQPTRVATAAR